ncbi:MAG: hypothetical protein M1828_001132 [Chrysothrix sp. TS-e1954]|nr:MAG: hypothetical protein M1828_001132 [Chrysothrix sp. TS-e1954]
MLYPTLGISPGFDVNTRSWPDIDYTLPASSASSTLSSLVPPYFSARQNVAREISGDVPNPNVPCLSQKSWTAADSVSGKHAESSYGASQPCHIPQTSSISSPGSRESPKQPQTGAAQNLCYLSVSEVLKKLNETLTEGGVTPLDTLLDHNRDIRHLFDCVLSCQCCLACESSQTMIMLLLMVIENFIGRFETRLEDSVEEPGEPSMLCDMSSDKNITIGSFTVDAEIKQGFMAGLITDTLSTQLDILVRLEAKAEGVLKGMFRKSATDMMKDMRKRLSLLGGRCWLSSNIPLPCYADKRLRAQAI